MSKTKQILQFLADGNSQRRIATTLAVSRNTVASVVAATKRSDKTYNVSANNTISREDRYESSTFYHIKAYKGQTSFI